MEQDCFVANRFSKSQSLEQPLLEGREGPTRTAVFDSCRGSEHPLPQGPPILVGGGDAWLVVIWRHNTADLSVGRDFSPGQSPSFKGSGVAKLARPSSPSAGVHRQSRMCCVLGLAYLVLSHCSKGTRSQGGGPQVCRKVVRACSQPQSMFLHFETRRSGVGEGARQW